MLSGSWMAYPPPRAPFRRRAVRGGGRSDMVLKAHSLTQQVNRLSLQAGRLPEKADECVVDAWRYDESALGSVIRLSDNNSADTMDTFASREYTVVGVAASPM